jgi:hypothetical protein
MAPSPLDGEGKPQTQGLMGVSLAIKGRGIVSQENRFSFPGNKGEGANVVSTANNSQMSGT